MLLHYKSEDYKLITLTASTQFQSLKISRFSDGDNKKSARIRINEDVQHWTSLLQYLRRNRLYVLRICVIRAIVQSYSCCSHTLLLHRTMTGYHIVPHPLFYYGPDCPLLPQCPSVHPHPQIQVMSISNTLR